MVAGVRFNGLVHVALSKCVSIKSYVRQRWTFAGPNHGDALVSFPSAAESSCGHLSWLISDSKHHQQTDQTVRFGRMSALTTVGCRKLVWRKIIREIITSFFFYFPICGEFYCGVFVNFTYRIAVSTFENSDNAIFVYLIVLWDQFDWLMVENGHPEDNSFQCSVCVKVERQIIFDSSLILR